MRNSCCRSVPKSGFRHPLVRSASYTAGSPEDRRAAHLTLAAATDGPSPIRSAGVVAPGLLRPPDRTKTWRPRSKQAATKIPGPRRACGPRRPSLRRSVDVDRRARGRHTERGLGGQPSRTCHARRRFDIALGLPGPSGSPRGRRSPACPPWSNSEDRLSGPSVTGREAPVLLLAGRPGDSKPSMPSLAREDLPLRPGWRPHLAGPLGRTPAGYCWRFPEAAQAAPQPAGTSAALVTSSSTV